MDVTNNIPIPSVLAHTLNVRGDLGMFVNPFNCSCLTCCNYVNRHGDKEHEDTGTLEAIQNFAFTDRQMDILIQSLNFQIESLKTQQEVLLREECRSHDEMAAQDQEFDELDSKIAEIQRMLDVLLIQ